MRIEGAYSKDGKYWVISIPGAALFTQGKSKKDAFFMVQDAVRGLIDDPDFKTSVEDLGDGRFYFVAEDSARFFAFVLKRGRLANSAAHENTGRKTRAKSRSDFSTYEDGKTDPTLTKACELLEAAGMSTFVVSKVKKKA